MSLPKIARYIISGGTAAFINIGSLFVFVNFMRVQYLVASVFSFTLSFLVSFALQKFWTFNNQDFSRMHFQLTLFLFIALINLLINTLLVYVFVAWFGFWYLLAQLIAGAIIAVTSYFAYHKFVFASEVHVTRES